MVVVVVLDRLVLRITLIIRSSGSGEGHRGGRRNIGVAFIPPFTLTCVCVCACVCVYVCTTESEDRVLIIHAQTKQKKDIFFRPSFLLTSDQCTHYKKNNKREEERTYNDECFLFDDIISNIDGNEKNERKRPDIFPRFSGASWKKKKRSRRIRKRDVRNV